MDRPLTRAEKRLLVREFMQRDKTRAKRRRFFRAVFAVGVGSAIVAAIIACFVGRSLLQVPFAIAWLCSFAFYTEALTVPRTLMQDMDPWWHLNRYQEAFQRLAEEGRQTRGVVLLAIFPVLQVIGAFVRIGLK